MVGMHASGKRLWKSSDTYIHSENAYVSSTYMLSMQKDQLDRNVAISENVKSSEDHCACS